MINKKVLIQIYMLSISALVLAQTEFKGRVVDQAGNSVAGALIQASSQNTVSISDINGYFTYNIMPSSVIPVVSRRIEHNGGMHVWVDRTGLKCSIYNKGYYSIQLLTLQGKIVYSHRQYFDLSGTLLLFASGPSFSQGIYIANIQTPDGNFRAKLIKFHNEFQVAKIYPGRHIDHRLPGYSKTSALLSDTIKVSAVEYFDKKYPVDPGITGTTEIGNVVLIPVSTTSGATGPDGVIEVGTITILGVERVIYGDLQKGSIVSKYFYDESGNRVELSTYYNNLRQAVKEKCGNFGLLLCADFQNSTDTSEIIEVTMCFQYQIPDSMYRPTDRQISPIQDTAYAHGSANLQNIIGPNNLVRTGGVQGDIALSWSNLIKLKDENFISCIELKNTPPPPPQIISEYSISW